MLRDDIKMMKQKFTILWVEDKSRVITSNEKELNQYFTENYNEFELKLLTDNDGTKVDSYLKEHDIDLVVTDYNLTDDMNGLEVLKKIRRKKYLTDVLFYSASGIKEDLIDKVRKKGFVEIVKGKDDIPERVKKLVDKNMSRYEDIIFLRGLVISRIIDLELEINDFFVNYFKIPETSVTDFHNFILENQNNSMGGKVKTLESITKKHKVQNDFKKLLQHIRELANNRNLLAHCKTNKDNEKIIISMGDETVFDKKRICELMRKVDEASEEFIKLSTKLNSQNKN